MIKFEPTRTSSDLTVTERLRELLDERGVEYRFNESTKVFEWHFEGTDGDGSAHATEVQGGINIIACSLTPEQAIAATLGRSNVGRYVGLRQGEYWERTENSDYYCGGCGWKVTDHDSYCPECGGALHKAALDSSNCTDSERTNGTCRNISKVIDEHGQARFACSECGAWIDSRMLWNPEYRNGESPWVSGCKLNYCPNCGRRVEVDE